MNSFNSQQIKFMRELGLTIDLSDLSELSSDDVSVIEEKVADCLQTNGFDKDYKPTSIGLMCESILDILAEI